MTFPASAEFAVLIQDAAAVVDNGDLRAILLRVADTARTATGASYGALGVLGDHGTLSDFIHAGMSDSDADRIGRLPIGRGVLGTLIRTPSPIVVDDISAHPDFSGFPDHHPSMRSFLGVPVYAGRSVFGNLYLTDKPDGFDDDDVVTAQALAAVAGGAVSATRLHARLSRVAVTEDRERIARDLHDAVIQDLFATGLSLQALTMGQLDEAVGSRIADAVDRIDEAIEALRSFIFDLRRVANELPSSAESLERTIHRLCTGGEELRLDLRDLDGVPAGKLDTIIGIVREAVSNACRHSGCTWISVTTERSADGHVVVVADDGGGFDASARHRGLGLDNMYRRIEESHGRLQVDSSADGGTIVTATIPD